MAEIAAGGLTVVALAGETPPRGVRIFLCHNRKDKDAVRMVAEALELDYGLPYFLDATAIPTGEAYLPWIERGLEECSACAIFLGGEGWGPTHQWEAEYVLARQRRDLDFRVAPVALPGITKPDIAKLGSGSFFNDVNWANLTEGLDNAETVEKLRAALTGEALPGDRGPDRLTPYQIRRDAARWHKSGQGDDSILYRSRQLDEANRLARSEPDLLGVPDVAVFLVAAEEEQRRLWRRLAIAAIVAAAVILAVAITAYIQYRVAEARRQESVSRQLAMLSRDADGADFALLLGVEAYRMSPTAEAMRNLFEQSIRWNAVERMMFAGTSVEALAATASGVVLAGTDTGTIQAWDGDTGRLLGSLADDGHHGRVTSLYVAPEEKVAWVGREDGQIDVAVLSETGLADPSLIEPSGPVTLGQDQRVLVIAGSSDGRLVAAGHADGEIIVFAADTMEAVFRVSGDETQHVTALAFSADGSRLFAGDHNGTLSVFDTSDPDRMETIPGFDGGVAQIAALAEDKIGVLTGYGELRTLAPSPAGYLFESHATMPPLVSASAYDRRRGWHALGDANGNVHLRDDFGSEVSFGSLPPHRAVVRAVTFDLSGRLITAAADGAIAVWQLDRPLAQAAAPLPPLPMIPSEVEMAGGAVLAAATDTGAAGVWSLEGESWERMADLIARTAELGDDTLLKPAADYTPPADGFVDLSMIEVPDVALAGDGSAVAWTTQGGGIVWQDLSQSTLPVPQLLDRFPSQSTNIEIDADGTVVAALATAATVRIYDTTIPNVMPIELLAAAEIRSLALDRKGERLALGLEDGRVELIRIADGETLLLATGSDSPIDGITFSPDEARLIGHGVTSNERGLVVLAIADPGRPRSLGVRQAGGVPTVLALSEQAGYLAVGDLDGQVLLWRLDDLNFVTTLPAGGSNVTAIAFDEVGGRLVTAAADTGMLEWNLDPEVLIERACVMAGRDLSDREWEEVLPSDPKQPACPAPSDE